jgi:hypothetical protein
MDEIRKLLKISLGPQTQGKSLIEVVCYCEFEGHGRASETWEEHWDIVLPLINHHFKNMVGGWTAGSRKKQMRFHGKTFDATKEKVVAFLNWHNEQTTERSKHALCGF